MPRVASFVLMAAFACSAASAQSIPSTEPASTFETSQADAFSTSPGLPQHDVSLGTLMLDLGRHFKRLPSLETAAILGVGGGLAAWVHSEDAEITQQWSRSPELDRVFEPGATLGAGWVQAGGALGAYLLGRRIHNAQLATLGGSLIRAQTINALLTQGLKVSVRRKRPDGTSFSFPSGHSSATFATATVLQRHLGWKIGAPAYAVAAFVGASRLQENRHYLSDVLFGAAVGIVSGRAATIGRGAATFSISPLAAPGAVGVAFTHQPRQ